MRQSASGSRQQRQIISQPITIQSLSIAFIASMMAQEVAALSQHWPVWEMPVH
jgi:hypothetical protein